MKWQEHAQGTDKVRGGCMDQYTLERLQDMDKSMKVGGKNSNYKIQQKYRQETQIYTRGSKLWKKNHLTKNNRLKLKVWKAELAIK